MARSFASRFLLLLALSCCSLLLLHLGDHSAEIKGLKAKIQALEAEKAENCQEKCRDISEYGRWHNDIYGHVCLQHGASNPSHTCLCSPSAQPPWNCNNTGFGLADDMHPSVEIVAEKGMNASLALNLAAVTGGAGHSTPRDTVHEFCDEGGLSSMYGGEAVHHDRPDSMSPLESAILNHVAKELESSNVDKMAKDIFTFYVCVRWIPDGFFWEIAKQELAADLVQSIVDHNDNLEQAISELYQRYKFVPLLCSENMEVFGRREGRHHTYFGNFEQEVGALTTWIKGMQDSPVGAELEKIDTIFCGGDQMNAEHCNAALDFNEWVNKITSWSGVTFDTKRNRWEVMQALFQSFNSNMANRTWAKDMRQWKAKFPYHSFIDKPDGMPSDMSPTASQRFIVCFGKRVASDMHRRPHGQHIMTRQNNIGCHGWWDAAQAGNMLERMVALWKPPTCQLAEMVYQMKKKILVMFTQMNERFFDAMPTILMDEELDQQDLLSQHIAGFGPYSPRSIHGGDFIDGMRVSALAAIKYPPDCDDVSFIVARAKECDFVAMEGHVGTVEITSSRLAVLWDGDYINSPRPVAPGQLHVMPHAWSGHKSVSSRVTDLVAGISKVNDKATELFSTMFRKKYQGLSVMMSDSISKWIVCPVRSDVKLEALDNHLGFEDAAFQDFPKVAYAKWTGYQAKIPGEECREPNFLGNGFAWSKVCEISELQEDHVEKYFQDGRQVDFICPTKMTLSFRDQLAVLAAKKNVCFLRMTDEQARHYGWQYAGDFPARRQNDKKANPPQAEYELVKLLKVPHGKGSEVSFGRYCSLEELLANPRFCDKPQILNPWSTVNGMAEHLAGTVVGSLGVAATALQNTLAAFQKGVGNATVKLGEHALDGLFGTGRLMYRSGKFALAHLADDLPGQGRRRASLQDELFGSSEGGPLLHQLSFQRLLGNSALHAITKKRYQRFVLSYPCADFDPALHFSLRREWGSIARRMVREAQRQAEGLPGPSLLDHPRFEMLLRAEARVFEDTKNKEATNRTIFKFGASIQVTTAPKPDEVECSGNVVTGCVPADRCEKSAVQCVPKKVLDPDSWSVVKDQMLAKFVGALDVTKGNLADLHGIKLSVYCGEKQHFSPAGGSAPTGGSNETLLSCLQRGVQHNARLHAREPWRLYFKDEVAVVAVFDEIARRRCNPKADAPDHAYPVVCAHSASLDAALGDHIDDVDKRPALGKNSVVYRGFHSGAGYPVGTPREIVLRPEDILEAVDMLLPPRSKAKWD